MHTRVSEAVLAVGESVEDMAARRLAEMGGLAVHSV